MQKLKNFILPKKNKTTDVNIKKVEDKDPALIILEKEFNAKKRIKFLL